MRRHCHEYNNVIKQIEQSDPNFVDFIEREMGRLNWMTNKMQREGRRQSVLSDRRREVQLAAFLFVGKTRLNNA